MLTPARVTQLKPILEGFLGDFDYLRHRSNDPVELAWMYDAPEDREVVALLSSCLAYGRVELLKQSIKKILALLGPNPARSIREFEYDAIAEDLRGFVYRMTRAPDVLDLLDAMSQALRQFGSLEQLYAASGADTHVGRASAFVQFLRAHRRREEVARGFRYLLPDPADGSSCKRLHLFFRWVGRGPDGVDLGLWDAVSTDELIMPLDTHTSRLCRYIGLTSRKTVDGKMAMEVTESLKQLDPDDPLRYDFALCHLGISQSCIHERSEEHCPTCPIETICQLD
ncbi:MAG: TIGR02757 family protein [Myxococcota bacterium]